MTDRSRPSTRLAATIAAISLGLLAVGFAAAPASAAEARSLPEGSSLYALSCDDDLTDLSVFSLDVATAAATPVGEGNSDSADCAGQAAYNPVTSVSYFIAWQSSGETDDTLALLAVVDPTTGASLLGPVFNLDGQPIDVNSIAIGNDGAAYAIYDGLFFSLDLETAELTTIGDFDEGLSGLYGFSVDPTTGDFFAINSDGQLFSIDVTTGSATLVVETGLAADGTEPYSLQIDSAGVLWVEAEFYDDELDDTYSQLWSISSADLAGSQQLSGTITAPQGVFYTYSLLLVPAAVVPIVPIVPVVPVVPVDPIVPVVEPAVIVPVAPTLAKTGVDVVALAAGGALAALLGVALLVPVIHRRRRASA